MGTFEGETQALDVQVFTAGRYVPSDTLKGALVSLPPPEHPVRGPLNGASQLKGRLSDDELNLLLPLSGTWTKLTRSAQGLVIQSYCTHQTPSVTVKLGEGRARISIAVGQDGTEFEVMGVQRGKGGSVTLRRWNGHGLTQAAARNEEHAVNWTDPEVGEDFSGLFVHETEAGSFGTLAPTEKECNEIYGIE